MKALQSFDVSITMHPEKQGLVLGDLIRQLSQYEILKYRQISRQSEALMIGRDEIN
jgi:hypothetical protein